MSKKLSANNQTMKIEQDNTTFAQHDYMLISTNVNDKKSSSLKSDGQISLDNLKAGKLSQMSGIAVLSLSGNEANENKDRKNEEDKKIHSDIGNNLVMTNSNNIIPESPELSFGNNSSYCSQNVCDYVKLLNFPSSISIIQSIAKRTTYSTEPEISECSTILQSDTDKTISDYNMKENYLECYQNFNQSLQNFTGFMKDTAIAASVSDSNSSVNLICLKQISSLQTDSDVTLSGLNTTQTNDIIHSDQHANNHCDCVPDEITFIEEVENNMVVEELLNNQSLKKEFILDNVKFVINNSMCLEEVDCISDSLHEQFIIRVLRDNLAVNSVRSSTITNSSFQLSKQAQSFDIKTSNLECYERKFLDNGSLKHKNQISNNNNIKNNPKKLNDFYSQSTLLSLPLSQENTEYVSLPSSILLSNYCCEYDKAYAKKDIKPISYRNYYSDKIVNSLKQDFDKIITPKQSLQEFFNTTNNISEEFEFNLQQTLNNIVFMLQSDSNESNTMTENLVV